MPLVKTVAEAKNYLPLAYTNTDARLPNFAQAEEKYLVPILGNTLYQQLVTAYDANALTLQLATLLDRCQRIIVPFAYCLDLPFLQASITNNGLQRTEAENSRGAFKWEFNNVMEGLQERGYSAQETVLLFLDASSTDYPGWADSPYNSGDEFKIIRNGSDLMASVISIGLAQPYRTYLLLKPILNGLFDLYLEDVIGKEFYTAFSAKIVAGTLSADEKDLLKKLRMACARLAFKQASEQLAIRFGGDGGFTIRDGTVPTEDDQDNRKDPGHGRILLFGKQMEESGMSMLQKCTELLNSKASEDVFPEYYHSNKYQDPNQSTGIRERNAGRKIFRS